MKFVGLNNNEVDESRKKFGSNEIPDSKPTTFWNEFKQSFKDPMIRILLVIVCIMTFMFFCGQAKIYEPIGTLLAVIIVAVVTAKTSVSSDSKYRELKKKTKKDVCKVYRCGEVCVVNFDDVVVSDKVIVQAGDKIPADGVLVDGNIKVNNSVLNGEVEVCEKLSTCENIELPDTITGDIFVDRNFLFRGAVVVDGEGVLDVKKVGINTIMGKMAEEMQEDEPDSPLQVKLKNLANQISKFGYIAAFVIVVLYMAYFIVSAGGLNNYIAAGLDKIFMNLLESISLAILVVVCAVPEGLPLMISLVLMQNTSTMLDHNVLVRKAIGIETAGSLNILFSDKTGTITKGQLEVVEFLTGDGDNIPITKLGNYSDLKFLLNLAIGKNTSSMFDEKHRVIGGNVTDQAVTRFLGEDAYHAVNSNEKYTVSNMQRFNSTNKFSQVEINNLNKVFYKGAPEKLLSASNKCLSSDGKVIEMSLDKINDKLNSYASKAMRVLALGYSEKAYQKDVINDDLVIIGFLVIRDEVRQEAKTAISEVKKAGIQVVMITGDRLETAVEIAKDAGLIESNNDLSLTSSQLSNMTDDEIKDIVKNIRVIARALPTDKSRIVRICQEMNLVVGMTGDGVNDSPALKKADVGFAMGSGTEAAKEAGDIVILDDNFCSIENAILYGRTIYHNILKFCKFQLILNISAVVISAISPFFGIIAPLKVVHFLFINLIVDSLGAIMFGKEPALKQYMKEKPRRKDENIVSKEMFVQILVNAFWIIFVSYCFLKMNIFSMFFENSSQLNSAYFALFVLFALFNGFNVRSDKFAIFYRLNENPNFLKVWFTILIIQIFIVNAAILPIENLKVVSEMFSCEPFNIKGWTLIVLLAATIIPVDIFRKRLVYLPRRK